MKFFAGLFFYFLISSAHAFPEMVAHGYTQCISCHTSHVGGGLLNEYGRSLSKELLSQTTFGGRPVPEGDEEFLYGNIKTPKNQLWGGDIRLLQFFSESEAASRGRFLIMQGDLDFSWQVKDKWRLFMSLGRVEPRDADKIAKDYILSPRHGVEYLISDPESEQRWAVRVGRFMPAYGINFAEHIYVTRARLNLIPAHERYATELAWSYDKASLISTFIYAEADGNKSNTQQGGIVQYAQAVGENSMVGVNYYANFERPADVQNQREIFGLFAHIGFTKNWYGLFEADQFKSAKNESGRIEIFKLGYEVWQGLHLVSTQEYSNLNIEKSEPHFEAYSFGAQWFPRPHWDLYSVYRREKNTQQVPSGQDVLWFLMHFYL